jgi:hypothetical protein
VRQAGTKPAELPPMLSTGNEKCVRDGSQAVSGLVRMRMLRVEVADV